MFKYISACMYMFMYISVCMCKCLCVSVYVCVHVSVCMCVSCDSKKSVEIGFHWFWKAVRIFCVHHNGCFLYISCSFAEDWLLLRSWRNWRKYPRSEFTSFSTTYAVSAQGLWLQSWQRPSEFPSLSLSRSTRSSAHRCLLVINWLELGSCSCHMRTTILSSGKKSLCKFA